jgi:succinate dehydrogenase/fumarate reductase flavoprotein subunit
MWDAGNATLNGRAIEPVPYRTAAMGRLRELVRPPIPEFTVLGGMQVDRIDIGNLLNRYKSLGSFIYVGKLVANYALDRLRYGRHARVVMGQALIARLLHTASELGVDIRTQATTQALTEVDGKVTGLNFKHQGAQIGAQSRYGVLLATGGFGANLGRRKEHYESTCTGVSPASSDNRASLHPLVEAVGAHYGKTDRHPAFYAPVSTRKRLDGSEAVYPHFVFDRSKPGTICVNEEGERFINETVSYHDFGRTVLGMNKGDRPIWLIADEKAVSKYGLGLLRPGGDNPTRLLKDGYLFSGKTPEELAQQIGVPAAALSSSVKRYNSVATTGKDEDFGRGSTPYQQHNGDPLNQPNPTIRPLSGRLYAVQLKIGVIGTAKGFSGNRYGQLKREDGSLIGGLYAAGNDLQSIMGGVYPGPGITIGPAITFAYMAVNHAAGELA